MTIQQKDTDIRLDKWLWSARFFKTRKLSQAAIEGGKVHYEGHRVKPSKKIMLGATLVIRQGYFNKTVEITAITDKRKNASEAAKLYCETQDSISKRETLSELMKIDKANRASDHKPTKKQRRDILKMKHKTD